MTVPRLAREHWLFLAVAVLLAALFTGLGLWQLDRHRQAEARSQRLRARLEAPVLRLEALPSLPADTLRWRRVRARGRYDFGREVVLSARSHRGIPGVWVVTPLVVADSVALPVLRGWLPAPDGYHAPLEAGRGEVEGELAVEGVLLSGTEEAPGGVDTLRADGGHPVVNALHLPTLRRLLPYRIPGLYLQSLVADSAARVVPPPAGVEEELPAGPERPIRLPLPLDRPEPSAGGHLNYALQWFAFALIALVGGGIFVWRSGGPRRAAE